MITKIIWQTHAPDFNDLTDLIKKCINTWRDKNPEYQHIYMNDEECENFIKNNFDKQILEVYKSVPIPVMKADIWRLLVVYTFGGVYCDVDVMCVEPISYWLNESIIDRIKKNSKDILVCSVESGNNLCSATFAANANNKIIEHIIEKVFKNLHNIDISTKYMVHKYTAAWAFTRYIFEYLNFEREELPKNFVTESPIVNANKKALEAGLFISHPSTSESSLDKAIYHYEKGSDLSHLGLPHWFDHPLTPKGEPNEKIDGEHNRAWRGW